MTIRFQVSKPVLAGKEKSYAMDAIETTWISSNGQYISRFEAALASLLSVDECLVTSNGTTALHLACLAMNVAPGDEVIMPALTYVATANAVAYCGGTPIFVDCDSKTWNVTAESIEKAWTPRTRGVIVVHLYGLPGPVDAIAELCRARGAWLIEDCAESLGANLDGRPTGTFGDASTFSFYGNKTISTGEGGMVYVRDTALRRITRLRRGQGMDLERRYWHPILGYNYRMTNVAAAIGLGQIEMVDWHLSERRRVAARYSNNLADAMSQGLLHLPAPLPRAEASFWLYSVVLANRDAAYRNAVMELMASKWGIETRPFFVPMHRLPMYRSASPLPNSERLGDLGINLPTYSGLADTDIDEICDRLLDTLRMVA